MPRPRLALVPGEPAGIGPELCVRLAQVAHPARLLAYGDASVLLQAADALGLPLELLDESAPDEADGPGRLRLRAFPNAVATVFGTLAPANARALIAALVDAADDCVAGRMDGLVTGPINKAAVNAGGIAYTGTTGLLAGHAGRDVVMMLANETMRVSLATIHLPLRAVPGAITIDSLKNGLRIVDAALRDQFGIARPVIAVLGLNPHAGEDGHLGREEIEIMAPALADLRAEGLTLVGPLPADTAFLPEKLAGFDAIHAMYHDQGLPVLKYSGFESAVNLTLGLPYPRVAVDHGTALDLAGRGIASASSLFAAVQHCIRLAARRAAARA